MRLADGLATERLSGMATADAPNALIKTRRVSVMGLSFKPGIVVPADGGNNPSECGTKTEINRSIEAGRSVRIFDLAGPQQFGAMVNCKPPSNNLVGEVGR